MPTDRRRHPTSPVHRASPARRRALLAVAAAVALLAYVWSFIPSNAGGRPPARPRPATDARAHPVGASESGRVERHLQRIPLTPLQRQRPPRATPSTRARDDEGSFLARIDGVVVGEAGRPVAGVPIACYEGPPGLLRHLHERVSAHAAGSRDRARRRRDARSRDRTRQPPARYLSFPLPIDATPATESDRHGAFSIIRSSRVGEPSYFAVYPVGVHDSLVGADRVGVQLTGRAAGERTALFARLVRPTADDPTATATLTMVRATSVEGRVVRRNGAPFAGASVVAWHAPPFEWLTETTKTDRSGRFRFCGLQPSAWTIRAFVPDRGAVSDRVVADTQRSADDTVVTGPIRLHAGSARLTGTIVGAIPGADMEPVPVPAAAVRISLDVPGRVDPVLVLARTHTDNAGGFELLGLPDEAIRVDIERDDSPTVALEEAVRRVAILAEHRTVELGTIEVAAEIPTLVDAWLPPYVPRARVSLLRGEHDLDGALARQHRALVEVEYGSGVRARRFEIERPWGEHTLLVESPAHAWVVSIDVAPGTTTAVGLTRDG